MVQVAIHHPRAHYACASAQIDTVRIVSVDQVLAFNVAQQTEA